MSETVQEGILEVNAETMIDSKAYDSTTSTSVRDVVYELMPQSFIETNNGNRQQHLAKRVDHRPLFEYSKEHPHHPSSHQHAYPTSSFHAAHSHLRSHGSDGSEGHRSSSHASEASHLHNDPNPNFQTSLLQSSDNDVPEQAEPPKKRRGGLAGRSTEAVMEKTSQSYETAVRTSDCLTYSIAFLLLVLFSAAVTSIALQMHNKEKKKKKLRDSERKHEPNYGTYVGGKKGKHDSDDVEGEGRKSSRKTDRKSGLTDRKSKKSKRENSSHDKKVETRTGTKDKKGKKKKDKYSDQSDDWDEDEGWNADEEEGEWKKAKKKKEKKDKKHKKRDWNEDQDGDYGDGEYDEEGDPYGEEGDRPGKSSRSHSNVDWSSTDDKWDSPEKSGKKGGKLIILSKDGIDYGNTHHGKKGNYRKDEIDNGRKYNAKDLYSGGVRSAGRDTRTTEQFDKSKSRYAGGVGYAGRDTRTTPQIDKSKSRAKTQKNDEYMIHGGAPKKTFDIDDYIDDQGQSNHGGSTPKKTPHLDHVDGGDHQGRGQVTVDLYPEVGKGSQSKQDTGASEQRPSIHKGTSIAERINAFGGKKNSSSPNSKSSVHDEKNSSKPTSAHEDSPNKYSEQPEAGPTASRLGSTDYHGLKDPHTTQQVYWDLSTNSIIDAAGHGKGRK